MIVTLINQRELKSRDIEHFIYYEQRRGLGSDGVFVYETGMQAVLGRLKISCRGR